MSYSVTPNLGLKKPTPGADDDMWGTHWNDNATILDTAFTAIDSTPVSITFVLSGKPASGAIANAPVAMPLSVPAGLAGTTVFDSTRATSNAAFTLNRIVNGTTVTPIGAVTITPASNTSATLTGAGGTLAVGDVLQLIAPAQDATLSDVGITLLCSRI
jgi:hypothetical protein